MPIQTSLDKEKMSKKKISPEQTTAPTSNDLDQLRDILYGNQARATENRLNDLEARLEATRQELSAELDRQISSLTSASSTQLAETQSALSDQLTRQAADQSTQIKSVQENLNQVATDFNQRLEKQINDLRQGLSDFRAEARQRNDDLRQEMLALGAMLDKQKTGRAELGQLFVQLGQQLQDNVKKTADSTPDKD